MMKVSFMNMLLNKVALVLACVSHLPRKRTLLWASVWRITFLNSVFPNVCFDMMTPGMR